MKMSLALFIFCALPFIGLSGIRGPGRYSGVVVFDRWDACHLYSGVYVMEISEKVKETLRPFAGQAMLIDAKEVLQPMNPGDGLITKLQVLGPAEEPVGDRFGSQLEGLSLKALSNFGAQGGVELIIQLSNISDSKRAVDTSALAPTLLAKKQGLECFVPSDGPSFTAVTRTNVDFLQREAGGGSCMVNGKGRIVEMSLLPGIAISQQFDLASGKSIDVPLRFTLSPGEYQFLAGYGGGVHEVRALASNMISFDIDELGKPHLIGAGMTSEPIRTRRTGVVCGNVILADGSAAADTKVFLWPAPMSKSEPCAAGTTITKADGRFRMESVLEGQYILSAVRALPHSLLFGASGDRALKDAKVLDLPSFPENCSLQLIVRAQPTYTIRGRTEAADPAAETRTARIILISGDAYPFESKAAIHSDGRYEFHDVPVGRYQFFAGSTGSGFDVRADIEDVNIRIKWPDRTSAATVNQLMPAEFNEAMTITELEDLNRAEHTYFERYGQGFAKTLDVLGPPPTWFHATAEHAGLLDNLGTAFLTDEDPTQFTEFGYRFTYSGEADGDGKITRYTVSARPTQFGKTGTRNFFMDESGMIHQRNSDSPATKDDPIAKDDR